MKMYLTKILGGIIMNKTIPIFFACQKLGVANVMCEILSASSVILIRIWAVRKSVSLPIMKDDSCDEDEELKGRS